ncbi:MAG: hypothetical protein IJJ26_03420 [Victivallales bacterium]|nr:hypothetical protein [Victivallales bacterium]
MANDWPRWTVGPERKQVLFEKSLFKPMKEKEVLLSSVKYFAIGLGLWGYDTTRETAEIEIEGIQVTQPSDVFVIPRPTASVSIDGAYQKDWGFQDALYFWTPPAYCTLGAQQRVSKGERPSSKLSARYSLMYDDKNIYFLSLVTDPTPFQGAGGHPWENDSVELFLANGVNYRDLKRETRLDDRGFQIIFDGHRRNVTCLRKGRPVPDVPIEVRFQAENLPLGGEMVPGYVVEAAIPRKLFASPCEKGTLLAHAVKLNDYRGGSLCNTPGNATPNANLLNWHRAYFEYEGKEETREYRFGKLAQNPPWPKEIHTGTQPIWDVFFCERRQTSQTEERLYLNGFWAVQGGKNIEFSPDPSQWFYVPVPMNVGWATPTYKLDNGLLKEVKPMEAYDNHNAYWYERECLVPADWKGRQIYLHIAYVYNEAMIYIDGKHAGFCSSLKNTQNITSFVKPGKTFRLNVLVDGKMSSGIEITNGRGGIPGDVYLEAHLNAPSIQDVWARKADGCDKSFRIEVVTDRKGKLQLQLQDPAGHEVANMEQAISQNLTTVFEGTAPQAPAWSLDEPALCLLTVRHISGDGRLLDERKLSVGFRRFETRDARFWLNGKKLRIRVAGNSTEGRVFAPQWLEEMKRRGHNAINLHSYECFWNEPLYELLDRKGFLVQAPIPVGDDRNVAARIRQIRNHPCIFGYLSDPYGLLDVDGTIHNPFETDDSYMPSSPSAKNKEAVLARRDALFRAADPERRYIAQATGNWRDYMRDTHHYATNDLNLLDRMMFHYPWSLRKNPRIPLMVQEAGGPNLLTMDTKHPVHLWPAGKNGALVPRLVTFEAAARYLGDRAFLHLDEWHAMLLRAKFRDFRLNGVDGFNMWIPSDLGSEVINYHDDPRGLGVTDKRQLSTHYFTAPFVEVMEDSWMRVNHGYYCLRALTTYPWGEKYGHQGLQRKDNVYSPLYRNESQPLFLTIVGEEGDTFSQDHNYYGGETLRRRIAIVNDTFSNQRVTGTVELRVKGNVVQSISLEKEVAQGEIAYLPFAFVLPPVAKKSSAELVMQMSGREERLSLTLFPPHKVPEWKNVPRIGIVGSNGIAAKANFKGVPVDLRKPIPMDLAALVIERNALVRDLDAESLSDFLVRGRKVLVMEQNEESLLHYRAVERRLEHGFIADAAHPAVAGLDDRDLSNWRGCADSVPSEKRPSPAFRHNQSAAIETPHLTNRNLIAAFTMANPAYGAIHPIVTGGYDREEAILLEARHGMGSILFCQADVTSRYGIDPAATILADNLLKYLCTYPGELYEGVRYSGDKEDLAFLTQLGILRRNRTAVGVLGKGGKLEELNGCRKIVVLPNAEFVPQGVERSRIRLRVWGYPRYTNNSIFQTERLKGDLPGTDYPGTAGPAFAGTSATDFFLFSNPEMNCWKPKDTTKGHFSRFGTAAEVTIGNVQFFFCGLYPDLVKTGEEREKIYRVWSVLFNNLGVYNENRISFRVPNTDFSRMTWSFVTDPDGKGEELGFAKGTFAGRQVRKLVTGKIWEDQGVTESDGKNPPDSGYDGYAWYYTEVNIPIPSGKYFFHIGGIRDISTFNRTEQRSDLYLNGKKMPPPVDVNNAHLGGRGARLWALPSSALVPGKNQIAIRVYNQIGAGGIHRNPVRLEREGKNPDLLFPYEFRESKYTNYFFWCW